MSDYFHDGNAVPRNVALTVNVATHSSLSGFGRLDPVEDSVAKPVVLNISYYLWCAS